MKQKTAIIIGAGPAGLTAAYELLEKTNIKPIIYEAAGDVGGISRTVNYKGNYIDIGGHRFFSKSDRVMDWWLNIFPLRVCNQPRHRRRWLGEIRHLPMFQHRLFFLPEPRSNYSRPQGR